MLKSRFSVFFYVIFPLFAYCQNTIVKYEVYKKLDDQRYESFLIFDNSKSLYIEVFQKNYSNFQDLLMDKEFISDNKFIKNIKNDNIYENIFYGVSSIPKLGFAIYKDSVENIDWKLKNDVTEIIGMKCHLAEAFFRGRSYKVFYTTEISTQIGPWKLRGLPGLILKVDVDNGLFNYEAKSLTLNSSLQFPSRYYEFYNDHAKNIVPYENFIKIENKAYEELRTEQIAELPKGTILTNTPDIRFSFIEKDFNWK